MAPPPQSNVRMNQTVEKRLKLLNLGARVLYRYSDVIIRGMHAGTVRTYNDARNRKRS